jgi:hypothetical protein
MAMIHVNRSGQNLGIFDETRVREGLATGEFIGTDLGWQEGMPAWRPLSELESFGAQAVITAAAADQRGRSERRAQPPSQRQQAIRRPSPRRSPAEKAAASHGRTAISSASATPSSPPSGW